MRILTQYETVSGLAVNLHKSAITFSSKVQDQVKTRLMRILNIHNDGGYGKYLELAEYIGRKKKEIFNYIVEKVKQRTQGWTHQFLLEAEKETLLKTVALASPVYAMNYFKLSKGIFKDINGLLANYWWSKSSNKR